MLKHLVLLSLASLIIVFSMSYAQIAVNWLLQAHTWMTLYLADIFSGGQTGNLLKGLISLLSVPVLIGLLPTIIYWIIKRSWCPFFIEIVWVVWLIQAGALVVLYRAVV